MIKVLNIPEFTDGMIVIGVVHPEPWGNGIRWVAQPPTSTLMKQMIWKIDFLKIGLVDPKSPWEGSKQMMQKQVFWVVVSNIYTNSSLFGEMIQSD